MTVEAQVLGKEYAAEEDTDGTIEVGSSDLELMREEELQEWVGLRFEGLQVPMGAQVTAAHISFTADSSDDEQTRLEIYAESSATPANLCSDFSSNDCPPADDYGLTNRSKTDRLVAWDVEAWTEMTSYQTPDLSSIVTEVVALSEWSLGNAIVVLITGEGKRVAKSGLDGSMATAPTLTIVYRRQ